MNLKDYVAKIPDFPKKGIVFLDVTPIFLDGKAYAYAVDQIANYCKEKKATKIVGPEARGFLIGAPVASKLGVGFAPIRKPGKLPRATITEAYELEYGKNELSIHTDAITKGDRVVIVDDLLATGGTVKATAKLIERLGGEVVGTAYLIELTDLPGRKLLEGYDIYPLMQFTEN